MAGSIIICGSAIPQVVKTYRTRQAGDLSIAYLMTLMLGLALLQAYCLHVGDWIFIIGNSCSLVMTGLLIYFWFAFKKEPINRTEGIFTEKRSQLKSPVIPLQKKEVSWSALFR